MKYVIIIVGLILGVAAEAQQYTVTDLLTEFTAKNITFIPGSDGGALIFVGNPETGEYQNPKIVDYSSTPARSKVISDRALRSFGAYAPMNREPAETSVLYWRDGKMVSLPVDPELVKPRERKRRTHTQAISVSFARKTSESSPPNPFFTSSRRFQAYSSSLSYNGKIVVAFSRPLFTRRASALYELSLDGPATKILEVDADRLSAAMTPEGDVVAIASKSRETSSKIPDVTTLFIRRAGETSFTSALLSIGNKDYVTIFFAGRKQDNSLRMLIESSFNGKTTHKVVLEEGGAIARVPARRKVSAFASVNESVGQGTRSAAICGKNKSFGVVFGSDGSEQRVSSALSGGREVCVLEILEKRADGTLVAFVSSKDNLRVSVAVLSP